MNTEQIEEGNKLIADFTGNKSFFTDEETFAIGKEREQHPFRYDDISETKFHSSWDWLMPAVKKIQQLKIAEFTNKKPVMAAIMDVEIESLWNSVVVFIKWYNQQTNK